MSECCPTCRHTFDIFHLMRDIARNTRFLHYFSSRVLLLKTPFFIRDVISDKAHFCITIYLLLMVFNNYILSVSIDQPVTLYTIIILFVLMYVTIIHVHICTWLVCDLNQSACSAEMKMSSIIMTACIRITVPYSG